MNPAFFDAVRGFLFNGKLTAAQVDGMESLISAWDKYGDGDDRKLAYILATSKHETANTMQPITEIGRRSYFDKYEPGTKIGKALGNVEKGDGYRYRGRGHVQLTGRANYVKAGRKLGVDLVGSPDDALNPTVSARICITGCLEGWFTGRKLSDYIGANANYIEARRVVNGTDRAVLIAGYAEKFAAALAKARKNPAAPTAPAPPIEDFERDIAPPRVRPLRALLELRRLYKTLKGTATMPASSANVGIKSAWASKINWTMAIGIVFNIAAAVGLPLDEALKVQIMALGSSAIYVLGYIQRTWFTTSVTAASAEKL